MKLGDSVRKMTTALGIPHCGGCEQRRLWLNDLGDFVSKLGSKDGVQKRSAASEVLRDAVEGGGMEPVLADAADAPQESAQEAGTEGGTK